ncbi:hypothetical protein [Serratia quinivorans]|uniref:hypothetical protein n=1 Tax=Serratia quinivorans TaxID=137545 RepID=UPI003981BFBF
MQNDIQSKGSMKVIAGVLLTRGERMKGKQRQDILLSARREAKKIITQAQEEAQIIHDTARCKGYEQGVLAASRAVADHMDNYGQLASELHQKLAEKTRQLLSSVLGSEAVFVSLLENELKKWKVEEKAPPLLELSVPVLTAKRTGYLLQQLERIWPGLVKLTYHEGQQYVFKHQGQVTEFIPDEFIHANLPTLLNSAQLQAKCQTLSQEGLAQLKRDIMHYFNPALSETTDSRLS